MSHKPFLLPVISIILLLYSSSVHAENVKIIPLKKPQLDKTIIKKKIEEGIIKPKIKPSTKVIKEPENKKKIQNKKKIEKKIGILVPKTKPIVIKKEISTAKKKSQHFRQKDYNLAKKAIQEIKKKNWPKAIKIAKKAKDKSIYNFVQWRYLLTKGNNASFYDYQLFINKNND